MKLPEVELRDRLINPDGTLLYPRELPSVRLPVLGYSSPVMTEVTRVGTPQLAKILTDTGFASSEIIRILHISNEAKGLFVEPKTGKFKLRDTGEPVFYHMRGVALILMFEFGIIDINQILAALSHDFIEDADALNNLGAKNISIPPVEFLTEFYGQVMGDIVFSQTKLPYPKPKKQMTAAEMHENKIGTYLKLLKVFRDGNRVVYNVRGKTADRIHNLRSADNDDMRRKKVLETRVYLESIVEEFTFDNELSLLRDAMEPHLSLLSSEDLEIPVMTMDDYSVSISEGNVSESS